MSLTQTEIVGFATNFLELLLKLLGDAASVFEGTGVHLDEIATVVTEKRAKALAANARQEEYKRALRASTVEVDETHDDLYRSCSGYLDAVIGAVGKGSLAAKNLQQLRSRIRKPGDQSGPVETITVVRPPDAAT